jgi:hypothetical protein
MIKIKNRDAFLLKDIPNIHPESMAYLVFWKEQKRRCIEGFWAQDSKEKTHSDYRWMPPNLYFYVNFGTILHQPEDAPKTAPKKRVRPLLRDIEWEFFYNFMQIRGFSGFSDDEEYSCNNELKWYESGLVTSKPVSSTCYNSKGEVKKYQDPQIYIRKLFNKPVGKPLYENEALNLMMLGSRGFGKSYLVGVGIVLHEWIFDGARYYSQETIDNPYKVEIFVGAALSSKSSELLEKFSLAYRELPGIYAKGTNDEIPPPFFKDSSGSLAPNNMKNPFRNEYQKKIAGKWNTYGSGSKVLHGIYTTENPEAAAGTRPGLMIIEEVGLMSNTLRVHGSNDAAQREGAVKFGSSIYLGTGGNIEKILETEVIFRNPRSYDFLEFEDTWEGRGKIGWFVPAHYALNQYKDENGNTKEEAALKYIMEKREVKRQSGGPYALEAEMMNYPIKPSEMFIKKGGSFFPKADLMARLAEVEASHRLSDASWKAELTIEESGAIKYHTSEKPVVRDFPLTRDTNVDGAIEIFEMPQKDKEGNIANFRYIAGNDPVDDDDNTDNSLSLQSTFIYDLWTDRIVAEYTARTYIAEEYYEQVRRLLLFYNATLNYEQQKKGLYAHFKNKNSLYLLAETPEILKDKSMIKKRGIIGNKIYGTNANDAINAWGRDLILNMLLRPAYGEEEKLQNIHKISSIGLLKELIGYDGEINCDRVSALSMCLILREDMINFIKSGESKEDKAKKDFWEKTFENYKNQNSNIKIHRTKIIWKT